uniref:Nuclear receptor domain-containing protein n=1 Tax=Ditylenchus dipsaci TaxID=166011 RepID=A0A915DMT1_9BILA
MANCVIGGALLKNKKNNNFGAANTCSACTDFFRKAVYRIIENHEKNGKLPENSKKTTEACNKPYPGNAECQQQRQKLCEIKCGDKRISMQTCRKCRFEKCLAVGMKFENVTVYQSWKERGAVKLSMEADIDSNSGNVANFFNFPNSSPPNLSPEQWCVETTSTEIASAARSGEPISSTSALNPSRQPKRQIESRKRSKPELVVSFLGGSNENVQILEPSILPIIQLYFGEWLRKLNTWYAEEGESVIQHTPRPLASMDEFDRYEQIMLKKLEDFHNSNFLQLIFPLKLFDIDKKR